VVVQAVVGKRDGLALDCLAALPCDRRHHGRQIVRGGETVANEQHALGPGPGEDLKKRDSYRERSCRHLEEPPAPV
jgi:hypothetical protein